MYKHMHTYMRVYMTAMYANAPPASSSLLAVLLLECSPRATIT